MRLIAFALAPVIMAGAVVFAAQSAGAPQRALAFEVASVRPSEPGPSGVGGVTRPVKGLVRAVRATVRQMVMYACNLDPLLRHDPEPVGGPAWADTERFDIVARGPADLSFADSRAMLLSLLKERFKLQVHVEKREVPVYALVQARVDGRLGTGLQLSKVDCSAYTTTLAATGRAADAKEAGPQCGLNAGGAAAVAAARGVQNTNPRGAQLVVGTATIAELLTPLMRSAEVGRKVIDRTALTGTFDIQLTWVPAQSGTIVADPVTVLSIFTALQEQLGLKLESDREAVDVVVIDSMERPTPD